MNKSKQELLNQFMQSLMRIRRIAEQSFVISTKDKSTTLLQNQALLYLKNRPESTVGELAKKMGLSSSSAAQLIERLINLNVIKKIIDKNDHRIIHLILTKRGQIQTEISHCILSEKVGNVFFQMPEEDLKEVVRIFTKFLKSIEK
jgi:DNA-binding MarR family transcriptional regulator